MRKSIESSFTKQLTPSCNRRLRPALGLKEIWVASSENRAVPEPATESSQLSAAPTTRVVEAARSTLFELGLVTERLKALTNRVGNHTV